MSTLLLIRHGQATPFEADPDRLSQLGQQQARLLGAHWLERGVEVDEVYTGRLTRQQHTAQLVGEELLSAGRSWPQAEILPGLNEYDADGIWRVYVPQLVENSPRFAELYAQYRAGRGGPEHHRLFQRAFEYVMTAWQQQAIVSDQVESWTAFRDRVRGALQEIVGRPGGSRRVAVFTSGGPIGVTIQWVMQAADRSALEVNWRVRNSSISEFVFTRDRITLDAFNTLPHLADRGLWSYR